MNLPSCLCALLLSLSLSCVRVLCYSKASLGKSNDRSFSNGRFGQLRASRDGTGKFFRMASPRREIFTVEKREMGKSAVVIGGGPVGLATALMLNKLHGYEVVVIEKRQKNHCFESANNYMFNIDGRGQKLTNLLGFTDSILSKVGISNRDFANMTDVFVDGSTAVHKLPMIAVQGVDGAYLPPNYMIPRESLLCALEEIIELEEGIVVKYGHSCVDIKVDSAGSSIEVIVKGQQGIMKTVDLSLTTNFLIGCDGMHGFCRKFMEKHDSSGKNLFKTKKYKSSAVSAGLKFKVLGINSRFIMPKFISNDNPDALFNYFDQIPQIESVIGGNYRRNSYKVIPDIEESTVQKGVPRGKIDINRELAARMDEEACRSAKFAKKEQKQTNNDTIHAVMPLPSTSSSTFSKSVLDRARHTDCDSDLPFKPFPSQMRPDVNQNQTPMALNTSAFIVTEPISVVSIPEMGYTIRGVGKGPKKALSLEILPVRDGTLKRTSNIIAYKNHEIWDKLNPKVGKHSKRHREKEIRRIIETMFDSNEDCLLEATKIEALERGKEYFKYQFPQLSNPSYPLSNFVTDEDLLEFVITAPKQFPMPQYSSALYGIIRSSDEVLRVDRLTASEIALSHPRRRLNPFNFLRGSDVQSQSAYNSNENENKNKADLVVIEEVVSAKGDSEMPINAPSSAEISVNSEFAEVAGLFEHSHHDDNIKHCNVRNVSSAIGAILLLGDSSHEFPPELAQGVNSGMEDVYELHKSLAMTRNDNILPVLASFEKKRIPQLNALIKLAVVSLANTDQGPLLLVLLSRLNFAARFALNKANDAVVRVVQFCFGNLLQYAHFLFYRWMNIFTPFVELSDEIFMRNQKFKFKIDRVIRKTLIFFHAPAFYLVQDPRYKYTTILKAVHSTTMRLQSIFIWLGITLFTTHVRNNIWGDIREIARGVAQFCIFWGVPYPVLSWFIPGASLPKPMKSNLETN